MYAFSILLYIPVKLEEMEFPVKFLQWPCDRKPNLTWVTFKITELFLHVYKQWIPEKISQIIRQLF